MPWSERVRTRDPGPFGVTGGERSQPTAAVFADLLDLMPCAAFEMVVKPPSQAAAVTYLNRVATEMYGLQPGEAMGRTVRDIVQANVSDTELARMSAALFQGDGYYETETAQRDRTGREMIIRARLRARVVDDEWRVVATVEDITDERRLRLRLEALRALVELAPDAIFALDGDRRIVLWNKGAETMFGFMREEVIGEYPDDVLRTEFPIRAARSCA